MWFNFYKKIKSDFQRNPYPKEAGDFQKRCKKFRYLRLKLCIDTKKAWKFLYNNALENENGIV